MKKLKYLEAEGNTVEEAIEKALQELKLPRHSVNIEICLKRKRGFWYARS